VGSNPILDGNGVKAMPGSIPAPNRDSFNNRKKMKNTGISMGHAKNYLKNDKKENIELSNLPLLHCHDFVSIESSHLQLAIQVPDGKGDELLGLN